MGRERPEVVYVERGGDNTAKWFLWGALAGAAVALLYAPSTGEQTRRSLQRRLRKMRALAEEKVDELMQSFGGEAPAEDALDEEAEDGDAVSGEYAVPPEAQGRADLERRLADARARRRRRREEADAEDAD